MEGCKDIYKYFSSISLFAIKNILAYLRIFFLGNIHQGWALVWEVSYCYNSGLTQRLMSRSHIVHRTYKLFNNVERYSDLFTYAGK